MKQIIHEQWDKRHLEYNNSWLLTHLNFVPHILLTDFYEDFSAYLLNLRDDCQFNTRHRYFTVIQRLRSNCQVNAQPLFKLVICAAYDVIYITAMLRPPHPEITREFVVISSLCSRLFEPDVVGLKELARWSVLANAKLRELSLESLGFSRWLSHRNHHELHLHLWKRV